MHILVSVVHSPPSTDGERGQGHFMMFANRAGKGSGGLLRFVLGAQGLFSPLTESRVGFCAARRLSWAGRGESSAALGVSTDLGLQPNLKGHV